jgi:peptidyl-prolyl cis-trans isomerase D
MAWVLLGIITLVFIFWGIGDIFTRPAHIAAKVNGQVISQSALRDALDRLQNTSLSPPELQKQALEGLIRDTLLSQTSTALGLVATQAEISRIVRSIPDFQNNGQFSETKYRTVLHHAHYTPQTFESELQRSVLVSQLEQAFIQTEFSLPSELETLIQLTEQRRDVGFGVLSMTALMTSVSPEDIKTYYESHKNAFQAPEKVRFQYIQLSRDAFKNEDLFLEKSDALATLAFQHKEALEPIAEALKLPIQTTGWVTREDAHINPIMLKTAFEDEQVKEGQHSDMIELDSKTLALVRLVEHQPAAPLSLEAAADSVKYLVQRERAVAQAELLAREMEAALQAGASPQRVMAQYKTTWQRQNNISRQYVGEYADITQYAFSLPKEPGATGYTVLANGNVAVVQVLKVTDGDLNAIPLEQRGAYAASFAQGLGQLDFMTYTQYLAKTAKIQRF